MTKDCLITRDSKGKIRIVEITCDWDSSMSAYVIRRYTSQFGGKISIQPVIIVDKGKGIGKGSRTVTEQATLEYNSRVSKYKDKGYKILPKSLESYSKEELDELLPEFTTDSNGFKKHMLAKQADKVSTATFDKIPYWYASRKIDGLRCSFYYEDGKILTASRGGGDYNYSTTHLTENPKFLKFFENNPDIILDGELYKHGKLLQQISGAARLEKNAYDCDWLEYYIYDVMVPNVIFEDRLKILNNIQDELNLSFEPERKWEKGELQIQMVPQEQVSGWNNIKSLHDKYVAEGWEGCVIRDPNKVYKFGGRGSEMIKVKMYKDDTFKVTGIEQGLRKYDDMVFILETSDGKEFKAKPFGDKNLKIEYTENFEEKYKGHIGECKFFYYSANGVPLQPAFKAFRFDLE